MEQIKRLRSNINDDYDESKRKKISITTVKTSCVTNEYINAFEDLSNELIYEIFEYLDFHQAFEGFYDLNTRFQNLFVHSNFPIKSNISSISKSAFHRYSTHIIVPHAYRIKSFQLSTPFAADMSLLLFPIMINLTRLESLSLNNIECDYIGMVMDCLFSLPVSSSLIIISIDNTKNQNDIYYKIFRLPSLKYCQILIETLRYPISLSIATNEFSPIEHLIINNKVGINQLDGLLSYVPQLRRVSLGHLDGYRNNRVHRSSITLNYLTDVSLKLYSVSFQDFEQLIIDLFHPVQVLRIAISGRRYGISDREYLNADRWEQLISTHTPNLRIFDIEHQYNHWYNNNGRQVYESQVNKFNSSFWMKHQWFFEHQYYQSMHSDTAVFYSVNLYRRKHYMLYEGPTHRVWSSHFDINEDPVHDVYIHSINAMTQFVGDFPKATALTLHETFDVPRDTLVTSLNRIIPLRQLTKLSLGCLRLRFMQLIELLHFTPNVRILKLASILLYGTDTVTFEENEIFQKVSNTNIVTNVIIDKEITLDKIQLLVVLLPRLEYITINLYEEALEPIARFLLTKPNKNTRHLSTLCVSKQRRVLVTKLRTLIESEKLLYNYTIKVINRKLYLWW